MPGTEKALAFCLQKYIIKLWIPPSPGVVGRKYFPGKEQ